MPLSVIASELEQAGIGYRVVTAAATAKKQTFKQWYDSIKKLPAAEQKRTEEYSVKAIEGRNDGGTAEVVDYWISNNTETLRKAYARGDKASVLSIRQLKAQLELLKKFKKEKKYRSVDDVKSEVKKLGKNAKLYNLTLQQFKDYVRYADSSQLGTDTGIGRTSHYRPDVESYQQVVLVALLKGLKPAATVLKDNNIKQFLKDYSAGLASRIAENDKALAGGKKAIPRGYKTLKEFRERTDVMRENLAKIAKALK